MKMGRLLLSLLAVAMLAGCSPSAPDEKLTSETVRRIAEEDELDGLTIVDFVRQNGWADADYQNKYTVRYNYAIQLTKPLPEVILALAQGIQKDNEQGETVAPPPLRVISDVWNLIRARGDEADFQNRLDKFIASCPSCKAYLQSAPTTQSNVNGSSRLNLSNNFYYFVWVWDLMIKRYGFADDTAIGSKVPRYAWASFMKTENGWVASSSLPDTQ